MCMHVKWHTSCFLRWHMTAFPSLAQATAMRLWMSLKLGRRSTPKYFWKKALRRYWDLPSRSDSSAATRIIKFSTAAIRAPQSLPTIGDLCRNVGSQEACAKSAQVTLWPFTSWSMPLPLPYCESVTPTPHHLLMNNNVHMANSAPCECVMEGQHLSIITSTSEDRSQPNIVLQRDA